MKITAVILLAACLSAAATGKAQKVSLTLRDAPLEKALKEIKRQTGLDLLYTVDVLQHARPVTIELRNADLRQALDQCFKEQPLTYTIVENVIVVKLRPVTSAEGVGEEIVALPIDVKGRVVDTAGNPVAGASVTVKGDRTKGTTTDENGYFELKGVDENATLVISGVNIEGLEVIVNSKSNLSELIVKMKVGTLDETIVQAYGTTTRRFNVGSISKVSAEEISKQPISNPLAALQGRVPGLTVSSTSGLPGASVNIQIRGQNSLNPDPNNIQPLDNPLFVIDGVPFAPQNGNLNQFNSVISPGINLLLNNLYGGISPFNSINPSDIESIEVLRDADATAIYGSRGANGVILITTKRGKSGKTGISFNVYTGINHVTKTMPMMNTSQYLMARKEAFSNDGIIPDIDPNNLSSFAPDLLIFDSTKFTDWKDFFVGNSSNTLDANLSISGGNTSTQFLIGAGMRSETNIFPDNFSNKRGSANTRIHHETSNRRFKIDLSANFSFSENNFSSGGDATPNLLMAYSLAPNYPDLRDNNGDIIWQYKGVSLGGIGTAANPYSFFKKKYSINTHNLISNLQLTYEILPDLTIRSSFGFNYLASNEYSGNPVASQDPFSPRLATADFGDKNISSWIIEPQLEYTKLIGKGRLNILGGGTIQKNITSATIINASGYPSDALIESVSGAPDKTAADANSEYRYGSVFGRINYIHDRKYILNLSGRRDGSSRFGPGKQFGNFSSIGAGWLFKEENFMYKINFLSYGKLRMSYGTTGNDNIGDYKFVSTWAPTLFTYQNSLGYTTQNLFNPNFSWGITKKFEAGLEIGILSNKLFFTTTWFRNRSANQLVYYPLPTQTGFANVIENLDAVVQNRGWEFQLSSTNFDKERFKWKASLNITVQRNKVVSFPGIENSSYAGRYIVGQPISVLSKFRFLGVNETSGLFQFMTANGDSTSTPSEHFGVNMNDEQIIGNLDPKFYGGISNVFSFRNFELDLFVEFKKQLGVNYLAQVYGAVIPGQQVNLPTTLLTRWQKPGDKSEFQQLTSQGFSSAAITALYYYTNSSAVYSDASYVRFKTISLSYNFSRRVLDRIKLAGFRLYLTGQNLFTITNYKGNDPETQSFYGVPVLKTFAAGIQITL